MRQQGVVASFDQHRGLGTVRAADGREHLFHCLAIADCTRTVEVGTTVTFELIAKLGRFEAWSIEPG